MTNKTCRECKHYVLTRQCKYVYEFNKIHTTDKGCASFEQAEVITNGDAIRQMSNKNLAIFFGDRVYCFTCPTKGVPCFDKPKDVCYQKWLDWLNAPAESEGEDE